MENRESAIRTLASLATFEDGYEYSYEDMDYRAARMRDICLRHRLVRSEIMDVMRMYVESPHFQQWKQDAWHYRLHLIRQAVRRYPKRQHEIRPEVRQRFAMACAIARPVGERDFLIGCYVRARLTPLSVNDAALTAAEYYRLHCMQEEAVAALRQKKGPH